ncbi:methylamine methyltransferase corrinoid protein reductive activase [Methanolobus sediminis]|uniref:Methylamine methyltransferase corrinoid protein reductive activase n=1 Tax=Methanolobus sediminis TaxID=3072978 RepID=A0AA51YIP5_9EURY|nr:methylamine methyltransferase corrinoid protein reductive activase [Methanolobus sediminis]WMW24745.1 methylamine methyltransferase corrinoid protein reductive activase [Methanolobus sediminis]
MYGIALDVGTSGFRAQLIDLETKEVVKTSMTMKHPLPGGNVTDHLDFAISIGEDVAHGIIIDAVEKMIEGFDVDPSQISKMAVCGNPIQLSLFQNAEIRDLAYAGRNMQKRLGIEDVHRDARIFPAMEIFHGNIYLENCEIIVPPAIEHEIGADALAMMVETDFLEQEVPTLVTDYGTNAEMAIKVGNRIITGSAAAGPAIEGQGISCGMLAAPGAITDVDLEDGFWRISVLNEFMDVVKGHLIDPVSGTILVRSDVVPTGITGTGLISILSLAIETGIIISPPKLKYGKIKLGEGIEVSEEDIKEAGKAIGAIRAAQLTLIHESGIAYEDLETMYMSGASGTYVDSVKARNIGSCPDFTKKIVQFGNTSLSLARDIVLEKVKLDQLIELAGNIKADHLMMATSETFKKLYACELGYWTEGMSMEMYRKFMKMSKLPELPAPVDDPVLEKKVLKDISEDGTGQVEVVEDIGFTLEELAVGCVMCHRCEKECPENAISIQEVDGRFLAEYDTLKCLGTACRRCVSMCPVHALDYKEIKLIADRPLSVLAAQAAGGYQ